MSDASRRSGASGKPAAVEPLDEAYQVPTSLLDRGVLGSKHMRHVEAQRESAHQQIQRTLKVWRAVTEGGTAPMDSNKIHLMPK